MSNKTTSNKSDQSEQMLYRPKSNRQSFLHIYIMKIVAHFYPL